MLMQADFTQIPLTFPGWEVLTEQALYSLPLDDIGLRRLMAGIVIQARRDANSKDPTTQAEARGWLLEAGKLYVEILGADSCMIDRWAAAGWPEMDTRVRYTGWEKGEVKN